MNLWPKKPFMWFYAQPRKELAISVPFTWNLPELKAFLTQKSMAWESAVVGGPAIDLMPGYLEGLPNVELRPNFNWKSVLQRINPMATRTTTGCIRRCNFCGIGTGRIESGGFIELDDWPDLPILCDNNLLASSLAHFDKVMDRLEKHAGVDFNQGLDARLLNEHHAQRLARLKTPAIRLACDSTRSLLQWQMAFNCLIENGVKKGWVSTYALIGFDTGPDEAWDRCAVIQQHTNCLPMWFHELDALEWNQITPKQREMGWTHTDRTRIMRRYYQAKYGGYREDRA
jgi:hypothetical protein